MYYKVLVAGQGFHGSDSLTYAHSVKLTPGQIVSVPLQRKNVIGVVESQTAKPKFATKPITSTWNLSVPKPSLELMRWLFGYYPAAYGSIVELFTPPVLPKNIDLRVRAGSTQPASLPKLTPEQSEVINFVEKSDNKSFLLHGDTASGKTRVYLELAKKAIKSGKSVIVLTPEIGLTEPLLETFKATFSNKVLITHSNMTPAQRRTTWIESSISDEGLVVIGPRSALFSPLKEVGLIIMDEAHDTAFKQEQSPRYQTSRAAAQLARLHDARFVMGSATPLVADYFAFKTKQLPILRMVRPAIAIQTKTKLNIVDLKQKDQFNKSRWLSDNLVKAIGKAIEAKEQSLLFLNRRGSARLVLCESCGWQATCPNCDSPLTYHHDSYLMRCHSCDFSEQVPISCPTCGENDLVFNSIGTKALESELSRLFPKASISRFDRDTKKEEQLSKQYKLLMEGKIDVIIGTQTVAKGFDLPQLSVVAVVQADSGLQIPDYTANERTFQLISQVSGRIGRGHRPGQLFVQTYQPNSELISLAINKDYQGFYDQELKQRLRFNFPPYVHLLKITAVRASSQSALKACEDIAIQLRPRNGLNVEGPSPRFIEKKAGKYAWHLIIKSKKRSNLTEITEKMGGNYVYDLDPSDLL